METSGECWRIFDAIGDASEIGPYKVYRRLRTHYSRESSWWIQQQTRQIDL